MKFQQYLQGAKFTIKTDHKPLKYLLSSPQQNARVMRWAVTLSQYDCDIEYIPGKNNCTADFLSRVNNTSDGPFEGPNSIMPGEYFDDTAMSPKVPINLINTDQINYKEVDKFLKDHPNETEKQQDPPSDYKGFDLAIEQRKDPQLLHLINILENTDPEQLSASQKSFVMFQNRLCYIPHSELDKHLKLYLPEHLRQDVLNCYHTDMGHLGITKTYENIRSKYYWPDLYRNVVEMVSACHLCTTMNPTQKVQPFMDRTQPKRIFETFSLDFYGPLRTTSSGNCYILTVMEEFSSFIEAFATPDKSAATVANILLSEIFCRYGTCEKILTDRGQEFCNKLISFITDTLKVTHVKTSPYNPRANSKNENFHRLLTSVLAKYTQSGTSDWDVYIPACLAAYRFSAHSGNKYSPFELLYKTEACWPIDTMLKPIPKYTGDEPSKFQLQNLHRAFVEVEKQKAKSRKKMHKYNTKSSTSFEVGDSVYLKNNKPEHKLSPHFFGHYRIIEKRGPLSYKVQNTITSKTYDCHASNLIHTPSTKLPKVKGRKAKLAAVYSESEELSGDDVDSTGANRGSRSNNSSDHESSMSSSDESDHETSLSTDSDNIPLAKLRSKLKVKRVQSDGINTDMTDSDDKLTDKKPGPPLRRSLRLHHKRQKQAPVNSVSTNSVSSPSESSQLLHKLATALQMVGDL